MLGRASGARVVRSVHFTSSGGERECKYVAEASNLIQETCSLRSLLAAACVPYGPQTMTPSNKQLRSSCLMTYSAEDAMAIRRHVLAMCLGLSQTCRLAGRWSVFDFEVQTLN